MKKDLRCACCGDPMWRSPKSLPDGQAMCQPCRRTKVPERATPVFMPCPVCGSAFEKAHGRQRYCSRSCRRRGSPSRQPAALREARESKARTLCAGCGETLPPQSRPGNPRKWCSEACRVRHTRQPYVPVPATAIRRACRFCATEFVAPRAQQKCCAVCRANHVDGPPRRCTQCGSSFLPRVWSGELCSFECFQQTLPEPQFTGKGYKDRARHYGVYYEPVDRLKVFERDGWFCMLCQQPVDRGFAWPHPQSVSLDHVVPLSLGGAHSYLNTQCAHLRCNIAKGARLHGRTTA